MNRSELADILYREGVNPDYYSLRGGQPHDGVAIDRRDDEWVVYRSERGAEGELERFTSEDEACRRMLERIMDGDEDWYRFQPAIGPVPAENVREALDRWLTRRGIDPATVGDDDYNTWHRGGTPWIKHVRIRTRVLPHHLRAQPMNAMRGIVESAERGTIVVRLPDGRRVTSFMRNDEVKAMRLKAGVEVTVTVRPADLFVLKTVDYGTHPDVADEVRGRRGG